MKCRDSLPPETLEKNLSRKKKQIFFKKEVYLDFNLRIIIFSHVYTIAETTTLTNFKATHLTWRGRASFFFCVADGGYAFSSTSSASWLLTS